MSLDYLWVVIPLILLFFVWLVLHLRLRRRIRARQASDRRLSESAEDQGDWGLGVYDDEAA